jgi:tRNA G18 (ribose-2'-O)-methylase SpoU
LIQIFDWKFENKKMDKELIKKNKNVYEKNSKISTVISGKIMSNTIVIDYQTPDYKNNLISKFSKSFENNNSSQVFETPSNILLTSYSPSRKYTLKFKSFNKEKEDEVTLEIWSPKKRLFSFNCKDLHGKIYNDNTFQKISWNEDEDKILYVAEKKREEKKQFWEESEKNSFDIFKYEEDWGEQYTKKYEPRIFIINIKEELSEEVKNLLLNHSLSTPSFGPNDEGVLFTAYDNSKRKLGIRACNFILMYCNRYSKTQ